MSTSCVSTKNVSDEGLTLAVGTSTIGYLDVKPHGVDLILDTWKGEVITADDAVEAIHKETGLEMDAEAIDVIRKLFANHELARRAEDRLNCASGIIDLFARHRAGRERAVTRDVLGNLVDTGIGVHGATLDRGWKMLDEQRLSGTHERCFLLIEESATGDLYVSAHNDLADLLRHHLVTSGDTDAEGGVLCVSRDVYRGLVAVVDLDTGETIDPLDPDSIWRLTATSLKVDPTTVTINIARDGKVAEGNVLELALYWGDDELPPAEDPILASELRLIADKDREAPVEGLTGAIKVLWHETGYVPSMQAISRIARLLELRNEREQIAAILDRDPATHYDGADDPRLRRGVRDDALHDWLLTGLSVKEIDSWVQAGASDPDAVSDMAKAGIAAMTAAQETEMGRGDKATVARKVSRGDLSVEEAVAILRPS